MEEEKSDELVEVSVVEEEAPAPEESALSGTDDAPLTLERDEHERHHEVTSGNCDWLVNVKTAKLNHNVLKSIFVILILLRLTIVIFFLDFPANRLDFDFKEWAKPVYRTAEPFPNEFKKIHAVSWFFGVFNIGVSSKIALFAALFALFVNAERPGHRFCLLPRMVQLFWWIQHKLKEFCCRIITELLPMCRRANQKLMDWLYENDFRSSPWEAIDVET